MYAISSKIKTMTETRDFFTYDELANVDESKLSLPKTITAKQGIADSGAKIVYTQTPVMYDYAKDGEEPRIRLFLTEDRELLAPFGLSEPPPPKDAPKTSPDPSKKKKKVKLTAYTPLKENDEADQAFIDAKEFLYEAIINRCVIPNKRYYKNIMNLEMARSIIKPIYKIPTIEGTMERDPSKSLSYALATDYNTTIRGLDGEPLKPSDLQGRGFRHIPLVGYTLFSGENMVCISKNWFESTVTELNSVTQTNMQETRRKEWIANDPTSLAKYNEQKKVLLTTSENEFGVIDKTSEKPEAGIQGEGATGMDIDSLLAKTSTFDKSRFKK